MVMKMLKGFSITILWIFIFSICNIDEGFGKEIQAEEILEDIKNGIEKEYNDLTIKGDLNFKHKFTMVNSSLKVKNCSIEGSVGFKDIVFNKHVEFNNVTFQKNAIFTNSTFKGDVLFNNSKFIKFVSFESAKFNRSASWEYIEFFDYTVFENCIFNDYSYFINSKFFRVVTFKNSSFKGIADLDNSVFMDAMFVKSRFEGRASFHSEHFKGEANFLNSTFYGSVDFSESVFEGNAVFRSAQFEKDAKFEECKFSENNYTSFEDSDFKGIFYLSGAKYKNIYIRWYNITTFDYNEEAYYAIMKNFKELGYLNDFDNAYYQYRVERRNASWAGADCQEFFRNIIDCMFLDLTYGYGTKPERVIIYMFCIFIIFGLIWLRFQMYMYSFSWKNVPGTDNLSLEESLKKKYGFDIDAGSITKSDDGKTIKLSVKDRNLSIKLDDGGSMATFKIDNQEKDTFIAKTENNELIIYIKFNNFFSAFHYSFYLLISEIKPFSGNLNAPKIFIEPSLAHTFFMMIEIMMGYILSILFIISVGLTIIRPMLYSTI